MDSREAQHLRLVELLKKELDGTLLSEERSELLQWIEESEDNRRLYQAITGPDHWLKEWEAMDRYQVDKAWRRLAPRLVSENGVSLRPALRGRTRPRLLAISGVAAVLILLGVLILNKQHIPSSTESLADRPLETDIAPGTNRAILKIGQGPAIQLNEMQTGIEMRPHEIAYHDGTLLEMSAPSDGWVELTVPFGGTYQTTLSDGTHVWVNAGSTLRYPYQFSGAVREVELVGEAYFEVTKAATPFRVRNAWHRVDVLGTAFNISAYPDESDFKTTLLRGKVRISDTTSARASIELRPGEQVIAPLTGEFSRISVDPKAFIAWKEGAISFDGKSFEEALREIGRWYDIDIQFRGGIPDVELFGSINRSHNLSAVLALFDSSNIGYELEERTLTIIHERAR